ncbi:hypothetical protein ACFQ3Z_29760 [Streptomyces nogalater]
MGGAAGRRPTTLLPQDLDLTELGDRLVAAAPLAFLKLTPGHLEILSGLPEERIAASRPGSSSRARRCRSPWPSGGRPSSARAG